MSYKRYTSNSYKSTSQPPQYQGGKAIQKALKDRPKMPNTPDPVNIDKYKTDMASISDISKKYGFDYSRDYAEYQAENKFRPKLDDIKSQRERLHYEAERGMEGLEHDYFHQFRGQQQELANQRLNAGIAAERNFHLSREMQDDQAEILAQAQLENQRLDRERATTIREQAMYADALYDERLQQGFENALDYSRLQQQENQFMLDAELRQRNQLSKEQWREFRFNNMSAAERAKLAQDEAQFGYEMAWRNYEFNNMSEYEKQKLKQDEEQFGMEMAWRKYEMEAGFSAQASGGAGNFTQYRQTSYYGTRRDPITGKTKQHNGNDYALPVGTPVATTVGGKVIASGNSGSGWGNYVVVQDANGYAHIYAHMSKTPLSVGSTVSPGQIIGASGNSGRSTGPHLHYEVRKGGLGGRPVNPNQWL